MFKNISGFAAPPCIYLTSSLLFYLSKLQSGSSYIASVNSDISVLKYDSVIVPSHKLHFT